MAYRVLIDRLHEALRAEGWTDVRPAYGFVLLAARDQPTSSTELATLMGTTKQAASKLIDTMVDARYVKRISSTTDARQRPVVLTARGEKLLTVVERIYDDLERQWAETIGETGVTRLRRDLVRVVSEAHPEQLPPVRPVW
jgi:DNA-binding MarR family transcriptional regulator